MSNKIKKVDVKVVESYWWKCPECDEYNCRRITSNYVECSSCDSTYKVGNKEYNNE